MRQRHDLRLLGRARRVEHQRQVVALHRLQRVAHRVTLEGLPHRVLREREEAGHIGRWLELEQLLHLRLPRHGDCVARVLLIGLVKGLLVLHDEALCWQVDELELILITTQADVQGSEGATQGEGKEADSGLWAARYGGAQPVLALQARNLDGVTHDELLERLHTQGRPPISGVEVRNVGVREKVVEGCPLLCQQLGRKLLLRGVILALDGIAEGANLVCPVMSFSGGLHYVT
mmetsp:Transcript_87569/g.283515  ORF Transcript_87569/g.283515 Transcript_87569/m.283515 type:complete len:233 (-) Transcript_87569:74-772(-)